MISSPWRSRRRLIPRWRSLRATVAARELAAPDSGGELVARDRASADLEEKIVSWGEHPSVVSAGELVGAALVDGREEHAVEAARLLLSPRSSATDALRELALLTRNRVEKGRGGAETVAGDYGDAKREWRSRARLHPANALAWVELSLLEIISGRERAAKRCMSVAMELAPNNRHVLRSACRLYLHYEDPGRAYDVIARCDAVRRDPWLMAAELAVAELAARRPKYFGRGRDLVDDGATSPSQFTELAGAVGTLELAGGRRRKARDYFRKSVLEPTGNALAQAEWASPAFGSELVEPSYFDRGREIEEAIALQHLNREEFGRVPDACDAWARTEPYAVRPFEIGSSASALIEDYWRTRGTAEAGLRVHPKSGVLLNNYAFALANLGEVDAASRILDRVVSTDGTAWAVSEANRGLVAMRRGEHDLGIAFYRNAINDFRRRGHNPGADIASVYLAREAALAGIADADRFVRKAREAMERPGTKGYEGIMDQAEQALIVARGRVPRGTRAKGVDL